MFAGISGTWNYAYVDLGKPVFTEKSLTVLYSNSAISGMGGTQGAQMFHVDHFSIKNSVLTITTTGTNA